MRSTVVKVALVAVFLVSSVALVSAPALADGGTPFQPTDNRVNPMTWDRLAVYTNPTSIDVLGIDTVNNGFYLTTFSWAEITSSKPVVHKTANGTVTLTLDQAPQMVIDNSQNPPVMSFTQPAAYHITWTGGSMGADGSLPFVKSFTSGYAFTPTSGK